MEELLEVSEDMKEFVAEVERGEIPKRAPRELALPGMMRPMEGMTGRMMMKDRCRKRGMWAIVDLHWTKALAEWIGKRHVLEVMASMGWLAAALAKHGVRITATDDFSEKSYAGTKAVYPVLKMDAVQAVKTYPADILLVSWPHYKEDTVCKVGEVWGAEKPIVYIGEGCGGCCAPEEFFDHFTEMECSHQISIPQWDHVHDSVDVGFYRREK